nr:lipopolysaccharide biosynthesis protein [Desulfobacter latus]
MGGCHAGAAGGDPAGAWGAAFQGRFGRKTEHNLKGRTPPRFIMSLTQKTITGIIWNVAEQVARKGTGVIITLLLARFLVPADFGLIAMMAVFLAVAQSLMNSGFKQALIRFKDARQVDFNTAFYANVSLGIISYLLLFLAAPFISEFYNEPRLTLLVRVAGLNIIIHSFEIVQSAVLSRKLNFKAQLQATLPAGIISGLIAVAMAYAGLGVWALIFQILLSSLLITVFLWKIQGWRPSLSFSKESLKSMYSFGYKLFLSGLLNTIFLNLYIVVIAKLFAASIAGQYFFAKKIKDIVNSQLVSSIQTVTYPALASIQDDDKRLKAGYRKVIQITTFILFPSMLLLAALARPLFMVLLPDKWLPAVPYLQLMCLGGVMFPLHTINLNILQVKGRSDLFLYLEIIKKTLTVIILYISYRYGVTGILIGQIIGSVLAYIPNSYFSAKLINYSALEQIADVLPSLGLSVVVALLIVAADSLTYWPAIVGLIVFGLAAVGLYLAGAHVLKLQPYWVAREMLVRFIFQKGDKSEKIL